MLQYEVELVQQQAEALGIRVTVTHYGVNRFSVGIGSYVYSDLHKALSALTTVYLKGKK